MGIYAPRPCHVVKFNILKIFLPNLLLLNKTFKSNVGLKESSGEYFKN